MFIVFTVCDRHAHSVVIVCIFIVVICSTHSIHSVDRKSVSKCTRSGLKHAKQNLQSVEKVKSKCTTKCTKIVISILKRLYQVYQKIYQSKVSKSIQK